MMKALKKYVDNRVSVISSLLNQPRQSFNQSFFHELRVEIKKLDAAFDLINFCSKKFKKKNMFEPFDKIFDQAGNVRDLQVEKTLMKKHFFLNALKDYRSDLRSQEQKERKSFSGMITKSLRSVLKNTLPDLLPHIKQV